MSNPIKYSTGSESLALKKGNFYIGTGDVGKGPSNVTGYYDGVTHPSGGYTIYMYKSGSPGDLSYHKASNDSELISFTNNLAGQSYTTVNQCLSYYAGQSDKICFNRDYEGIVTDGLVLNLDVGFTPSYPRNGTTLNDISINTNNGTLNNGPSFSSNDGGILSFDGSDDYVELPSSNNITGDNLQNMSGSVWLKYSSGNVGYIFSIKRSSTASTLFTITANQNRSGGTSGGYLGFLVRNNNNSAHEWITDDDNGNGYNDGNWHHVVGVVNGTNRTVFIDGVQKYTSTGGIQSVTDNTFPATVGAFSSGNILFNGSISNVMFYNRALSSSEILQNYNAQKGKFGL